MADQSIALDVQPLQLDVAGDLQKAYQLRQLQLQTQFQQMRFGALQGLLGGSPQSQGQPEQPPNQLSVASGAPPPQAPPIPPSDMSGNVQANQAYGGPAVPYPSSAVAPGIQPAPMSTLGASGAGPQENQLANAGGPAGAPPQPLPALGRSYQQIDPLALQRYALLDPDGAKAYASVGQMNADTANVTQAYRTQTAFRLIAGANDQNSWDQALQTGVGLGIIPPDFAASHGQYNTLKKQQMLTMLGGADNYWKMQGIDAGNGLISNADGTVSPMPGFAEQKANVAGQEAAGEYPYKVGEALASNAGRPAVVSPNEAVTTGLGAMIPQQKATIANPTGTRVLLPALAQNAAAEANQAPSVGGAAAPAQGGTNAAVTVTPASSAVGIAEQNYSLPKNLLAAQLQQESSGRSGAVNTQTATGQPSIGLAQFQPATAKQYNIDPTRPLQAMDGSAHMMSDLLTQFKGAPNPTVAALAAYNWGSGNVQKWLAQGGDWDTLPKETQDYVRKVLSTQATMNGGAAPPSSGAPAAAAPGADAVAANAPSIPARSDGFPPAQYPQGSLAAPAGSLDPYTSGLVRDPVTGALSNRMSGPSEELAKKAADEYHQDGQNFDAAQTMQGNLLLAQHAADQLNKIGWTSTGAGSLLRNELLKNINGGLAAMGVAPKDQIAPDDVANFDSLMKTSTQMGFNLARTLGTREAMQIVQQAIRSVPNVESSPSGFRLVAQSLGQAAQRQIDFYNFATQYARDNKGVLVNADVAFNQKFPPQMYAQRAINIAKIPPEYTDILKSRPDTVAAFDKHFGPGLGEYVLQSQAQ